MFDISYTEQARKYLRKLNGEQRRRIISTLDRCKVRPHAFVKKLVASPYFRLRVGDYRLIVDIRSGELIILVVDIGHRKNIYK